MALIDVESLLKPVSEALPCGIYDEYDQRWNQLDMMLETGGDEGMVEGGAVAEIDWKGIYSLAEDIFKQCKHLRLGAVMTRAATEREGLAATTRGLQVLRGLCEQYWLEVYPNEPDEIPFRPEILEELSSLPFIRALSRSPLSESPAGRFSYLEWLETRNPDTAPLQEKQRLVNAAFENTPQEHLAAVLTQVQSAIEEVEGLTEAVDSALGAGKGVNLGDLTKRLREIEKMLAAYVKTPEAGLEGGGAGAGYAGGGAGRGSIPAAPPGEVSTRAQALEQIEKIAAFFERTEPTNPAPYMLRRARRFAEMNFMDLVEEITGDLSHAENILGKKPEEE